MREGGEWEWHSGSPTYPLSARRRGEAAEEPHNNKQLLLRTLEEYCGTREPQQHAIIAVCLGVNSQPCIWTGKRTIAKVRSGQDKCCHSFLVWRDSFKVFHPRTTVPRDRDTCSCFMGPFPQPHVHARTCGAAEKCGLSLCNIIAVNCQLGRRVSRAPSSVIFTVSALRTCYGYFLFILVELFWACLLKGNIRQGQSL